jgi:hypothetical protein
MAEKPKVTSAGVVNVSQQYAANQRENRTPTSAPTAAPAATGTPFGQAQKPATTQTLNLYGSPASIAAAKTIKPAEVPTKGKSTTAKTDAQINAELAAVQAGLDEILKNVSAFEASYNTGGNVSGSGATTVTPTTATVAAKKEVIPNVAYDTIQKILESYRITGLASVLESIRDEYPEASSTELLTLLQFDSRYNAKFNERFAANVVRQKAGKPVLSPGEYLKLEQAYSKVFQSYNLPKFNTQDYYDKFIVADTDPTEVTERVQMAYDRIMGDEPVLSTFKKFYSSLGLGDIVTGMLDPANQLPALQQKVKAAEIGGAAVRQGLTASELATTPETTAGYSNVTTGTLGADVLARAGVTKAQAEEGYQKIAQVLPTGEKLSSIYGKTTEQYGRVEAEQEQLQGLASAARKRQKLSELEVAQFKKSSGLGRGALGTITNI